MGVLDIFRRDKDVVRTNSYQINEVQEVTWTPFVWSIPNKNITPLGNFFLNSCLNIIWQAISNVSFVESSNKNMITPSSICEFIDRNAILLLNMFLFRGYIAVFYDKDDKYRVPNYNELKFDSNGRIINKYCIVIYSPQYQTERKSLIDMIKPVILMINKTAGTSDYAIDTLGTLGILSGQDLPTNPTQKDNFLKNFNTTYGLGEGKYPFLMTNREVTFTKIDPNIKDLKFEEKIKKGYQYICNILGIPLQLVFNDASTFSNMKEARIYFYNNTIRYFSEQLLKVARELLTASADFIPQNAITYRISNVPEIEETISGFCKERTALLDYLLKLKSAGEDVDKQIRELSDESKKILREV